MQDLFHGMGEHSPNSTDEVIALLKRDMNNIEPGRYEKDDLRQTPLHYNGERRRSGPESYLRSTVNEVYENGTRRYPLTISTNSLATRVLFTNDTIDGRPRATGVAYLQGQSLYKADRRNNGLQRGAAHSVIANREVIAAGGAFNTPQILKLSGIGSREELDRFGIPVTVGLPAVGENLQDNYEATIMIQAAQEHGSPLRNCTLLAPGDPCLLQWQRNGSGPYGNAGSVGTMLFRSSVSETRDADIAFFGAAGGAQEGFFPGFSIPRHPPNTSFWSAVKMQTQNRAGTVRLRSTDPQDVPDINFNYFQEGRDHDLQALAEAAEFVLGVYDSAAAPYGPYTVVKPDPKMDLRQAIMDEAYSHHATSTCVIGTSRADSCVDSRFRVHGVDGLRVVDASVFPRTPGGFPVLPVFMISEKATDVVLEDLSCNGTAVEH